MMYDMGEGFYGSTKEERLTQESRKWTITRSHKSSDGDKQDKLSH